jgi:SAM-dependent methyltransferase
MWDERVPVHVASRFYDVQGWLRDGRGPRPYEARALGDVSGCTLVHLQCHFGLDTLAWARVGARVTGVDFSGPALEAARSIAQRAGLADRARFVCSDVYDASDALDGERFDVVYVSLGALSWLPSVDRWAAVVAALLRPGGRLFVHEVHPLADALGESELVVEHSYFEEPEPVVETSAETYTDNDGAVPLSDAPSYTWNHSLGEIVTALIDHGLVLEWLREHDWTAFERFPWLIRQGDQHWALPPDRPRVPLSFSLLARRP